MIRYPKPTKDPRNLAWLFKSMSAGRFKELTDDYYRQTCLHVLSRLAEFSGCWLVPCGVVHWRRKKGLADRYIELFGKGYYMFQPDELTKKERQKYEELAAEIGDELAASGE